MSTVTFGSQGEEEAALYLQKKGYKILGRNFRVRGGELDIIAREGSTIVFVEVKTRTNSSFGSPAEAIHKKKLRSLIKTAEFYLMIHHLLQDFRIDAIEVFDENGEKSFNHIKNITF